MPMRKGQAGRASADEFVEFRTTGDAATGEHRCAECGYGIAVYRRLPVCPMCGGETWEPTAWRPFRRRAVGTSTRASEPAR